MSSKSITKDQEEILRRFVYFVEASGELSGDDIVFLKASYYDFKSHKDKGE